MPSFKYVVKNQQGRTIEQVVENENFPQLVTKLRNQDLIIISIDEIKKKTKKKDGKGRIKGDDLVVFSRQLATLLDAGVTLVQSLNILSEQTENEKFKQVVSNLEREIQGGKPFSDALLKYPNVFSSLFVNMVKVGEKGGKLSEILERLSDYLEKTKVLARKIKSALIYPLVVSCMAMVITLVLLLKVIPTFKGIFESLGGTLPLPTQMLITLSDLVKHYFLLMIFASVFLSIFAARYFKTEKGRFILDRLKLKLPVFGVLFRKVAVSKFCRTFSTLTQSGVPILNSLAIVGKTADNKVIEKAVTDVQKSIQQGESIASPLGKSKVFPLLVVKMIAVGEESGELAKMLSKIADFYEQEVDAAVSGLTSLIEPIIIGFLGIVVGSIAIAMLLPIFQISTLIK